MQISQKCSSAMRRITSVAKSGGAGSKKNIASLDGLRAFAALGVVTLHITYLVGYIIVNEYKDPWLASFWVFGNTGVQLFFVLSGFLLFMPYAKALLFGETWPSTRTFYWRRALRILPCYYFSLALLVIFVQPVYLHPDHWSRLFLFLTFFMDSSKATFEQIDVPYWSLGVEVQFYLLLPLVALGMRVLVQWAAHTPRRRFAAAATACAGLVLYGLAIRYVGLQWAQQPQEGLVAIAQFVLFGVRGKFWEDFAVGMFVSLCFIYAQHPEYGQRLQSKLKKISPLLALGALGIITVCSLWNFRASYPVPQLNFLLPIVQYDPWFLDFCVSLGWGLVIATLLFGYTLFRAPFEWQPVRWLGIISYSVYLWHFPMLSFFQRHIFSHLHVSNIVLSHIIYWSFFALVIIPWCVLVYWLVEKPFMRMKDRQKRAGTPTETKDRGHSSLGAAQAQEKAVIGSSSP
jgi:peptidoglycan/LPS O-acetylase OafA/YrhL